MKTCSASYRMPQLSSVIPHRRGQHPRRAPFRYNSRRHAHRPLQPGSTSARSTADRSVTVELVRGARASAMWRSRSWPGSSRGCLFLRRPPAGVVPPAEMTALVEGQQQKKPGRCRPGAGGQLAPLRSARTPPGQRGCTVAPRPWNRRIRPTQGPRQRRSYGPRTAAAPPGRTPRLPRQDQFLVEPAAAAMAATCSPFPSKGASCTKGWAFSGLGSLTAPQPEKSPFGERLGFELAGTPRLTPSRQLVECHSEEAARCARPQAIWRSSINLSELLSPSLPRHPPRWGPGVLETAVSLAKARARPTCRSAPPCS